MKGASNGWLRALRELRKQCPAWNGVVTRSRTWNISIGRLALEGRFLLEGVLIVGIKFIGVFRIAIGITAIKSDYPITSKIKLNLIASANIIELLGKYYVFQIEPLLVQTQLFNAIDT